MSDAIPEDTKYTAGDQIEFYDVGRFETSKGEVRLLGGAALSGLSRKLNSPALASRPLV